MTVKTRNTLLIAIGIIVLGILLLLIFSGKKAGRREPEILSKTTADGILAEFIKVKLFYYAESSSLLQPVYRELRVPDIREELYKKFIELLLSGGDGMIVPVPAGVQLRSVYYLQKTEMLVLDFNEHLISAFPGGTAAELEFIYFIVDNICFNFKEIKKVKLLSGGNEHRTLGGHIELEKAFFPDYSRLKSD